VVDPLASAAVIDLARAPTLRAAEIFLDQAQGAFRNELVRLAEMLAGSVIENQELPECSSASPASDVECAALAGLDVLLQRAEVGLHLISGWKIVISGRPNVGKSRLLNALAGFRRAIVDPAPGTTRDVVTVQTSFEGWPVELADTAGLRSGEDAVEIQGIARSLRQQEQADLILLVIDLSQPLEPWDHELIAATSRAILVANKSDLPAAWRPSELTLLDRTVVTVSAERGDGLPSLISAIVGRLAPDPPPPGAAVPFRSEHREQLALARARLLASDRTSALRHFAHLTGASACTATPPAKV
jgi:tRNA modification GTPase